MVGSWLERSTRNKLLVKGLLKMVKLAINGQPGICGAHCNSILHNSAQACTEIIETQISTNKLLQFMHQDLKPFYET